MYFLDWICILRKKNGNLNLCYIISLNICYKICEICVVFYVNIFKVISYDCMVIILLFYKEFIRKSKFYLFMYISVLEWRFFIIYC